MVGDVFSPKGENTGGGKPPPYITPIRPHGGRPQK